MILETKRLKTREMDDEVMYAYEHQFTDEDVLVWLNRNIDR